LWALAQVWHLAWISQLAAISSGIVIWAGVLDTQASAHLINISFWGFPLDNQIFWALLLLTARSVENDSSFLLLVW
jgi:hypothetical protein